MVDESNGRVSGSSGDYTRRSLLKSTAALGVLGSASSIAGLPSTTGRAAAASGGSGPAWADDRLQRVLDFRESRAAKHLGTATSPAPGDHPTNGDEARYDGYVASFTKGLPHDENGVVDPVDNYEALVDALNAPAGSGDFEAVTLGGERKLVTPGAVGTFSTTGRDHSDCTMAAPPAFGSDEMAAETVELYWRALLRDVPFYDYDRSDAASRAADELGSLSGYTGPTNGRGSVDADVLFRGNAAGAATGPYISQFLYKDVPRGNVTHDQRFKPYNPGREFVTSYADWLAVQNGSVPEYEGSGDSGLTVGLSAGVEARVRTGNPNQGRRMDSERYPITGRDLATYVHGNAPDQSFRTAALILLDSDVPLAPGNPLENSSVQGAFVDYGPGDIVSAVGEVAKPALLAAWHHKWRVHRKLRPETFGGRIHDHLTDGPDYVDISEDVLSSEAVAEVREENGTYLLPQAYPEASPTHPSYPAGHAVIAGACATVVKAFFDDQARVPDPVAPDQNKKGRELESIDADLTVAGEVNKLATNDSLGRDFAGIHYRSDAGFPTDAGLDGGLVLGERVAHAWLADRLAACAVSAPLSYTTLEGDRATVRPEA